ncbi:MAG: ATP-binding cassette domain-containing protein [Deltaproteobacteria bacterium]|nr:ATP-binding cassette domain-containing protein [Deltaproteobacteria bacterium]
MIEAKGLMVFYENMLALNNVSLRCGDRQVVGVFGANSAGKSTPMSTLSGILLDVQVKEKMKGGERISLFGEVIYDGEPIQDKKAHERARRGIVLCPERRRLFPESSVQENLKIGAYLATKAEARQTLEYCLEQLFPPLKKHLRKPAGFLSGGEQQMVAIGRALMAQPKCLLLDEPLLGLSPAIQQDLVRSIPAIRTERGISVIVTEQYARPVLPHVDYAYIVENGSTVLEGDKDELLGNPDVKAAYFGC